MNDAAVFITAGNSYYMAMSAEGWLSSSIRNISSLDLTSF